MAGEKSPVTGDCHAGICGSRGLRCSRPPECAQHDQQLGGASPLWRLMAPTTSRWQLLLREEGGKEARGEVVTQRTETAYEAWRSGRAGSAWRSPMSIKGSLRRRGGCAVKVAGLTWGDLRGCPRMPIHACGRARWVARDGGAREGAARRGEVSRRRSTSGIDGRWEGLNAKPSVRTPVLVVVALTAANPFGGLAGRVRR